MKRLILLFIAVTSFFAMMADKADDNIYMRMVSDADEAIAKGNFEQAERYLTDALNLQPTNPMNSMLISNLGMVRYYMGNDSLALVTLSHAHNISPASVTILLNRAKVLTSMREIDKALEDYDMVTELDSTVARPYFFRGMVSLNKGDLQNAVSQFNILKQLEPDGYDTNIAMAQLYLVSEQWDKALPYFSELLKLEPAPEFYSGRAWCYLNKGDLSEASDDIARGLKMNSTDPELFLCRAYLNKLRYRQSDSLRDAEDAIRNGADPQRVARILQQSKN
ncbi:MAG: tetratricopeptide repeat protein [Muribaculaceae bacterium]|nr:tetratricopeptide repeat protein [Muribaculaceae bacterium]